MDSLSSMVHRVEALREQVAATERRLSSLKLQLAQAEQVVQDARANKQPAYSDDNLRGENKAGSPQNGWQHQVGNQGTNAADRFPLQPAEYKRYGRQLILPEVGLQGQLRLKKAKVLIVGVGGLGCPAAAYLAGAGVGTIGLIDGDTVEVSNLHRQIAHGTERIGVSKVKSAWQYLMSLNPTVKYNRHDGRLVPESACALFDDYDLILDCTDHPTSRYLVSDACVLTGKPLVTASALKTEGQLMVLNNPPLPPSLESTGGPCYRCIFPRPPPADSVLSCGEGGILGPVVGVMGVLQALEALKLLSAAPSPPPPSEQPRPTLVMFSAYTTPPFRSVRLRSRRKDCAACSATASISRESLASGSLDYVAFCGTTATTTNSEGLPSTAQISARALAALPPPTTVLIDVRDPTQYALCALRGSVNVPWTGDGATWLAQAAKHGALDDRDDGRERFVVCRLGNDSQFAVRALLNDGRTGVRDVRGGFAAWRTEVDGSWPDY